MWRQQWTSAEFWAAIEYGTDNTARDVPEVDRDTIRKAIFSEWLRMSATAGSA